VIIASNLVDAQEEKLLDILKELKEAIGWTTVDIKGISPSFGDAQDTSREAFQTIEGTTEKAQPNYASGCKDGSD
jgi:hypothetical protein